MEALQIPLEIRPARKQISYRTNEIRIVRSCIQYPLVVFQSRTGLNRYITSDASRHGNLSESIGQRRSV